MKPKSIQEQKWMIHHFLFLHVFQLTCSGWLKLVSFVSYLKSEHIVFLLSATMSIKHVGLCLFLCFMWEKFYVRSFCGTSVISSRIFTLKHVSKPCLSFCGSYLSVTLNTQSYHLYSLWNTLRIRCSVKSHNSWTNEVNEFLSVCRWRASLQPQIWSDAAAQWVKLNLSFSFIVAVYS